MGHFAAIRAYHRSHGGGHWRLVGKSSRLRIRCRAVAAGMRAGPAAAGSQGSAVWGAPAVRPDSLRAADARARGLGGGAAKHQWFWHVVIGATGVPWFESIRADTARGARCGGGRRFQVLLSLAEFRKIRSEERRVGKECRSRWSPY